MGSRTVSIESRATGDAVAGSAVLEPATDSRYFPAPLWNARSREPAATTYVGTLPYPFQDVCVCPPPPPVELGQLVAQLVDANDNAIVEDSKPITCP